jgi:ribosomal peptide maturation radical SAM protein 1
MHDNKNVLIMSMPFAGPAIPSIQLSILEGYLKEQNINVVTYNLFLKAAEIYGLNNYNYLICSPNDSYTAQIFFSKYVFPQHWEKNERKFREHYIQKMSYTKDTKKNITFDQYVQLTDNFYNWIFENVNCKSYDIIGFTLNYGQLIPSLAIAKKIKELNPDKIIILGGSRTVDKIGINTLKAFDYIDFIISGDGEDALYQLTSDYQNYKSIPNLIFREGKDIIWNKSDKIIDINKLPIPSFDTFFNELTLASNEIKQYFSLFGRLPIEISRGCWWNKCSFCNLNLQHKKYREKNVEKIVEELDILSDKYKMLSFQIIGNALLKKEYGSLCDKIIELNKDFTFFVEARVDRLKSKDYTLLKKAGFTTIQTGIETFSNNYLQKMNKGTRVIDNIASLRFSKENGILNSYNILVNYPNEETNDFKETVENIQLFWQYTYPPNISYLMVGYGSAIYNNQKVYNINKLTYTEIDKILFPKEILEKGISYFYNFERKKSFEGNNWEDLVSKWKKIIEESEMKFIKSKKLVDKLIFYFVDGGNFIKIYDKRSLNDVMIYVLNDIEREVFLNCENVISFQELNEKISHIPEFKLAAILHSFEQAGIVFQEDDYYLSLPLNYSKCFGIDKKIQLITSKEIISEGISV